MEINVISWLRRGSPGFMRPVEILFPQSVGPADDIRGFCAVAWEFLTGHSIWHTLVHAYRAAIEVNFSIEVRISSFFRHPCPYWNQLESWEHPVQSTLTIFALVRSLAYWEELKRTAGRTAIQ